MPADKDSGTKPVVGVSRRGRGWAETRRILKTFAVLLIFFSKWVKLFYDFHRQFLATGSLFSLSLSLSFILSSVQRVAASRALSEAYFLIGTITREFSLIVDSYSCLFSFSASYECAQILGGNFSIRFASIANFDNILS